MGDSHCSSARRNMARMLVVVIACLLATSVIASSKMSDIVPEETEFLQDAPSQEMDGATVAGRQQANAVTGTQNHYTAGTCPSGTVRCADGVCAVECTNVHATASNGARRYHEEFQKVDRNLVAAPDIPAPPSAYLNKAAAIKAAQDAASFSAITHAEVSQGLVDAAQDSKQAERAEEIAAQKAKVNVEFNMAAAKGGVYKQKSQADDQAIVQVKQARLAEEETAKETQAAEEALKQAKLKEKRAEMNVSDKENLERRAKYAAEFAGQQYEDAKAKAVADDNAVKEQEHEATQEQRFRQVARAAVVKEAQEEAKRAAHSLKTKTSPPPPPPAKVVVTPNKKGHSHIQKVTTHVKTTIIPAKTKSCSDCTKLPAEYAKQGGTCSDCSTWAANGQCTNKSFKDFMVAYCAASCNCPESAGSKEVLLQLPSMPEGMVGAL